MEGRQRNLSLPASIMEVGIPIIMNATELKLIRSHDEVGNIRTFIFQSNDIDWVPGMFMAYTLPQAGESEEENQRYFTIASAPHEDEIHISTRITNSPFKQTLNSLQPGDTIQAAGLDGDFFWNKETKGPVVLVAAGIGVTPYRSMLLDRVKKGESVEATMLYFNRTNEIPFLDAFQKIAKDHPEFKLVSIVGEDITADRLLELAPQAQEGTLFISGPEPMVDAIGEDLKSRGVTVMQDWFPGYTEADF